MPLLRLICVIYLLIPLTIHAQVGEMKGEWVGISKNGKLRYQNKLLITDEAKTNSAFSEIRGKIDIMQLDSTKYISYGIEGFVENDKVTISGTELLDKKGAFMCMASYELTIVSDESRRLEGVWKPLLIKNGCLIGTGEINLIKDESMVEREQAR